jgi:Ca-activated chloride channel family protein
VTRFSIVVVLLLAGLTAGSSAQHTPASPPTLQPSTPQAPAQPSSPSTAANRQQPSFRSGIDIVSLNITVTDGSNHYVTDLAENDFSVFEDGVKQHVTFFSRRQQPVAMSLLLDSSASMEQHLGTLQTAATNFIKKLKPNDIAQVIDFDSRVEIRQGFTGNQTELQSAIEQTNAGGSTSLHNAIYIALKELRKVKAVSEEDVRRQALIVFSDGEDTSSLVSFEEVLDLAKRSETAIYAIALRGNDVQAKGFREAEFVMRTLAQETGGRAFFPARIDDLSGVYTQIADELASQYTLGYTSANQRRDGAWRRLVVQVARANITPRTKKGYYAPTSR